LKSNTRPVNFF